MSWGLDNASDQPCGPEILVITHRRIQAEGFVDEDGCATALAPIFRELSPRPKTLPMVSQAPLGSLVNVDEGDQPVLLDTDDVCRALGQVLLGRTPGRRVDGLDLECQVGVITRRTNEPFGT